jgi:HTH-type transcriptional regulator/antitoxin HigA
MTKGDTKMKISANSQYHAALAKIETFIEKGFDKLTAAETNRLKSISLAVEEYEMKKFPMPIYTSIKDVLEYYMAENNINKTILSQELEIPNSTLSEIISGKRKINLSIAKKMHKKLKVDGNFILEVA